jgi:hypothetical protein
MRPLTFLRAFAWLGAAVTFWSLNVKWGVSADVGAGPPGQWERHVVGAALLAFTGALALSISGRGGYPPALWARLVSLGSGAGIIVIAFVLRRDAFAEGFDHLITGPGWTWMFAGGGLISASALGAFGIKPPDDKNDRGKKRRRKR